MPLPLSGYSSPRPLDRESAGSILGNVDLIPYESNQIYNILSVTVTSQHCEDFGLCQHCYKNVKSYAAQDRVIR
jgi:hypothetical protein